MKVAAVFATMNRGATAATCVERLAGQTRPPWRIVVCDNGSSDDTVERLRSLAAAGAPLELIEAGENLGNAGGIERASERAFDAGADAVWILDDDSWPQPGALERLLDPAGPERGVRAALVIDPDSGEPSWPWQEFEEGEWVLRDRRPADGAWRRVRRAWLGALVPRAVRESVGPVHGALFLRGEDEDYPRRIEAAGFEFHLCPRSVLHHPPGGELGTLRLGGHQVVLERGLRGSKLYYRLRNAWWMAKRDRGPAAMALLMLAHAWLLARESADSGARARPFRRAAVDAWKGRLGRRDDLD